MMDRFCAYVEKIFRLGSRMMALCDARVRPQIPAAAVFAAVWTMFATRRGSLHGLEQDLRVPGRLRGLVGPRVPSADTIGRVYALLDPEPLRQMLRDVAYRLKRNKALSSLEDWHFLAIDGTELFRQQETLLPAVPTAHADGPG